jgi:Peptidase family M28
LPGNRDCVTRARVESLIFMNAMGYIRYLVEGIGPRGSTQDGEARAAHYVAEVLHGVGLEPVTEEFVSARSKYRPYALSAGVALLCEALFWFGGKPGVLVALGFQFLNLLSVTLELGGRPNPLRWVLPKGHSQNVYARLRPPGEVKRQVVLVAHLDTNRTPLLNSSRTWEMVFRWLLPVSFASAIALIALMAVWLVVQQPILRLLGLLPASVFWMVGLLMLQADLTPYTVGADDNASAVGVALSIASRLVRQPLAHTEVWFLLDGCEEVGLYGAEAFAHQHGEQLRQAFWIVLDSLGGASGTLHFTRNETLLFSVHSDPELMRIFSEVAGLHPELCTGPLPLKTGANATDGSALARHGLRQIALVAPGPRGNELLELHRPSDDLDHIDSDLLERCERFIWEVLYSIDL